MTVQAIGQVVAQLLQESKIDLIPDFVKAVSEQLDQTISEEVVLETLLDQIEKVQHYHVLLSPDKHRLIYRQQLFANTLFKVRLTAEEIRDKRMYIGHRLLPFVNPETSVKDLHISSPEDTALPKGEGQIGFMDGMKYIALIAPYQMADYFRIEGNELTLAYLDLREWMLEVDYEQEDLLQFVPIDTLQHQWRLEKLSLKDFNRARIKTNHKDVQLLDEVYDFLDENMEAFPVDYMLFKVFANGPKHLLAEPGSPIGPLLTTQDDIQLFNNDFPFVHYVDFHQQILEDTMGQMEDQPLPEPGTSTHLDGIFIELQTAYSETYIKVLFLNAMLQEKQISDQELLVELFGTTDPFMNADQSTHFFKAMDVLRSHLQVWADQPLALPQVSLLRKYLQIKRIVFETMDGLMETEHMMGENNLEQFFFITSVNEQLDQTADWLLDAFQQGDLPLEEIRLLNQQFDTMIQQFREYGYGEPDYYSDH